MKYIFILLGGLFLLLGMIGIVLPFLPTTPFILLASACFAKGSERFHQWLLSHPWFGEMIKNWQERRAIPLYAKILAISMMSLSCGMLFYRYPEHLWLGGVFSLICCATAIWMIQLPNK